MSDEQVEWVRMITQAIVESNDEVKQEIKAVRLELKQEIQDVRAELKEEIQTVRAELKEDIQAVRTEMNARFDHVDEGMEYLRAKVNQHDENIFRIKRLLRTVT